MRHKLTAFYRALKGDSAGNVAVLPLHGPIMAGKKGRQSINLDNTEKLIARAFSLPSLTARTIASHNIASIKPRPGRPPSRSVAR